MPRRIFSGGDPDGADPFDPFTEGGGGLRDANKDWGGGMYSPSVIPDPLPPDSYSLRPMGEMHPLQALSIISYLRSMGMRI